MSFQSRSAFCLAVLCLTHGESQAVLPLTRTIALSGQSAAGDLGGATFASFDTPVIAGNGGVVFTGLVAGAGVSDENDFGMWTNAYGTLSPLMREGDAAIGLSKGDYGHATHWPQISENGHGVFEAGLSGSGINASNNRAVFAFDAQGVRPVAQAGGSVPGSNERYDWVGAPSVNQSGLVSFEAWIGNNSGGGGLVVDSQGEHAVVARAGETYPALPEGAELLTVSGGRLADSGHVVFNTEMTGGPFGEERVDSLMTGVPGDVRLIAHHGMQVDDNGSLREFYFEQRNPKINSSGQVAFSANSIIVESGQYEAGLWFHDAQGLRRIAWSGMPAPGFDNGTEFSSLLASRSPVLNDRGDVFFYSSLVGGDINIWTGDSLWLYQDGELRMIAQSSQVLPGFPHWSIMDSFSGFGLNDHGQAFWYGGGPSGTSVWATDRQGDPHLVARSSEWIDVDDGPEVDLRKIQSVRVANGFYYGSDNSAAINDRGQIAFRAIFTDGSSGIFVSDVVAALYGDYNDDGLVDAADYTVWRDNLGAPAGSLPNDPYTTAIGQSQYDAWLANYGATHTSPAASEGIATPEPAAALLWLVGAAMSLTRGRRPATTGTAGPIAASHGARSAAADWRGRGA